LYLTPIGREFGIKLTMVEAIREMTKLGKIYN